MNSLKKPVPELPLRHLQKILTILSEPLIGKCDPPDPILQNAVWEFSCIMI